LSVFIATTIHPSTQAPVTPCKPVALRPHQHQAVCAGASIHPARLSKLEFKLLVPMGDYNTPGEVLRRMVQDYHALQNTLPLLHKAVGSSNLSLVPIKHYKYSRIRRAEQAHQLLHAFFKSHVAELTPLFVSDKEEIAAVLHEFDVHMNDWYVHNADFTYLDTVGKASALNRLKKKLASASSFACITPHQLAASFVSKDKADVAYRLATGSECFTSYIAYQLSLREKQLTPAHGVDVVTQQLLLEDARKLLTTGIFLSRARLMVFNAQDHADHNKENAQSANN
jgi:hypothetical protein